MYKMQPRPAMTLVLTPRFTFSLSPEREAAIQDLIAAGRANSVPHALLLEVAHYVRLPR
ncbi:MAG: hypothetical protein K2Y51_25700 [Gammaproteobacteria bacterium]|jgi:hypothetical protein|nr:hypothetical protein [Gammaproteobacteria bacterium]